MLDQRPGPYRRRRFSGSSPAVSRPSSGAGVSARRKGRLLAATPTSAPQGMPPRSSAGGRVAHALHPSIPLPALGLGSSPARRHRALGTQSCAHGRASADVRSRAGPRSCTGDDEGPRQNRRSYSRGASPPKVSISHEPHDEANLRSLRRIRRQRRRRPSFAWGTSDPAIVRSTPNEFPTPEGAVNVIITRTRTRRRRR